jgi:hypothetical protein
MRSPENRLCGFLGGGMESRPVPGVRNCTRAPEGRLPFGAAGGGAAGEAPISVSKLRPISRPLEAGFISPNRATPGRPMVRDQRVALVTHLSRARLRRG